jgi:hypothetical protein
MVTLDYGDGPLPAQHPLCGSESRSRRGHVFQDEAEENMVEVLIGKGQAEYICLVKLNVPEPRSLNASPGLIERGG